MDKQEAIRQLREIGESESRPLKAHRKAETVLISVLREYGLEDVADAYRRCENAAGGFWFDWNV